MAEEVKSTTSEDEVKSIHAEPVATSKNVSSKNPQNSQSNSEAQFVKKSNKARYLGGCLGCGCITIIMLLVIIGVILWIIGSSISNVLDSGRSYSSTVTQADFTEFVQKTGVDIQVEDQDLCFECPPLQVSGQKPATITISEEDVASWIQSANAETYGLEDLRVDIDSDGVAIATVILFQGSYWPIAANGTVSKLTENSLDISIVDAQAGPLPIPEEAKLTAEQWLETVVNKKLAETPGLTINTLEFRDGEVIFDGTVPEKIEYPTVDRAVPD